MRRMLLVALIGAVLLALVAAIGGAEELTVDSILAAHRSGAPADRIIAMVNNPANTVAMTAGDIVTLRDAGVPESVITAIWARIPAPTPAAVPLQPDDARLVDFVRLIKSGMSESIIAEQVRQSGQAYNLSVNDLLYLKENGAQESTIAALMATRAGARRPRRPRPLPAELVFDDLVLVRTGFWKKDRAGSPGPAGGHLRLGGSRQPQEELHVPDHGPREGVVHVRGAILRELLLPDQLQDREGRPLPVPGQQPRVGLQRCRHQGHGGAAHVLPAPHLRSARDD